MPATVRVSPSTRRGLRAILVIAAIIAIVIPVVVTVAHGASRLGYTKIETSQPLLAATTDLRFDLDTGAAVIVRTDTVSAPEVTLTGTGPRDDVPQLKVDEADGRAVISIDDKRVFENARIAVTVPEATSPDTNLEFDGSLGEVDVNGEFNDVTANTSAGTIALDGTFGKVQTMTDYGTTDFTGTYDSIEAKSEVGTIDGTNLSVRSRIDATTSAGTIDLDFANQMVPAAGITAKADAGTIDVRLPRLDLVKEHMSAEAAGTDGSADGGGDDGGTEVKDLFYRINATSNQGSVDLAKDLEQYDAAKDSPDAEGKAVIPVSVTADSGTITIEQN